MSFMPRLLVALLAALIALPTMAAETIDLASPGMTEWSGDDSGQVYVSGDLTMTLTVSGDESERIATLKVEKPGTAAAEVSGLGAGTGYGQVGVFPFDENGGRTVVFAVYAGGAHCCMQIVSVTETDNGFVTDDIGSVDGDAIYLEDLDGDGTYELPLFDGRFNYTFDAYAFSYAPQDIYKSKDGVSYDASADPRFRKVFETQVEERRGDCSGETYYLGVCAGLLGAAARLGTYEEELAKVTAAIEAGKTASGWEEFNVCKDVACSANEEVTDFSVAIDRSLRAWGYLPAR
jgi:hypothetical protein